MFNFIGICLVGLVFLNVVKGSGIFSVIAYIQNSGVKAVQYAYFGGVYSPTQNRIYFVPYSQGTNAWHYIDCDTGNVIAYNQTSGVPAVDQAYAGGVYSPTQNRIYFIPYSQGFYTSSWHYIDCNNGNVIAY